MNSTAANGNPARRLSGRYPVLIAVILLAGIYLRCDLPAQPFSDFDTLGYLYPSLSALTGGEFTHLNGRSFPYPLFLYGIQRVFPGFGAITLVQHSIGILSGLLMVWVWHRLARLYPLSEKARQVHKGLGVAILMAYLLVGGTVQMEHTIRPESLFAFFTILAVGLAAEFCRACYQRRAVTAAFLYGAALIYTSVLIYYLKPAWGFATVFATAPVIVSLFSGRARLGYKIAVCVVPVVLVLVTLVIPEKRLLEKYDPWAARFLPGSIFVYHAPAMRDEIEWELARDGSPAYAPPFLVQIVEMIDQEIAAKHNRHYPTLGFDPELLMRADSVYGALHQRFGADNKSYNAFCWHYYLGAWRHRPVAMLAAVAKQMKTFVVNSVFWKGPFEKDNADRIRIAESARLSILSLSTEAIPANYRPYADYVKFWKALEHSGVTWKQWRFVSWLHGILQVAYSFSLALTLLGVARVGVSLWRGPAPCTSLLYAWLFGLYLFSYNFWNTLSIAATISTEIRRYLLSQLSFTLLAEAWAILLLYVAYTEVFPLPQPGTQLPAAGGDLNSAPLPDGAREAGFAQDSLEERGGGG